MNKRAVLSANTAWPAGMMARSKKIYIDFVIRYIFVVAAISVGAAIFKKLEKSEAEKELRNIAKAELDYIREIEGLRKNLSDSLNVTIDDGLFESFAQRLKSVKMPTKPKEWTWNDGFHFAFTVMSTIGYGDVVPKTNIGKVVCILYAITTIPLFLIALSAAGQVKRFHVELLLEFVEERILKRSEIRHKKKKIIGITAVLITIEVLLASAISYTIEDWSYLDCVYFWVISASTIGFGDLVSDYNDNNGQLLFFNLLFNIIIQSGFATIFNAISEIVTKRNIHTFKEPLPENQEATAF